MAEEYPFPIPEASLMEALKGIDPPWNACCPDGRLTGMFPSGCIASRNGAPAPAVSWNHWTPSTRRWTLPIIPLPSKLWGLAKSLQAAFDDLDGLLQFARASFPFDPVVCCMVHEAGLTESEMWSLRLTGVNHEREQISLPHSGSSCENHRKQP